MTCKQMGGPCDKAFQGNDANEVIKAMDAHLTEMVTSGDEAHKPARTAMDARWQDPAGGKAWYEKTMADFAALPEDQA